MQAQNIPVPNVAPAIKLGTIRQGQKMHVRLLNNVGGDNTGTGTMVRLASDRGTLEIPKQFMGHSGYPLFFNDGFIEVQWQGEVYALGSSGNSIVPSIAFGFE